MVRVPGHIVEDMMSTLVGDVCRLHPSTFVGHDTIQAGPVPHGWRALVLALLGDLVEVLGPEPTHRIVILRVEFEGGLRVHHAFRPLAGEGAAVDAVVAAVIRAAERRSRHTCDCCGVAGTLTEAPDGFRSVRCGYHAVVGRPVTPPHLEAGGGAPDGRTAASVADLVLDFTRSACAAHPDEILDATQAEEVPPGWHRLCRDLLSDVAHIMAGARGRRFELHGLRVEGDALRWEFTLPPSTPEVVRRGILVAFRRAAEEADWTCRACGRPDGAVLDKVEACACGMVRTRTSSGYRTPRVTLPLLPPGVAGRRSTRGGPVRGRRRACAVVTRVAPGDADGGMRIPIYRRTDVAAALGLSVEGREGPDLLIRDDEVGDTEQHARLRAILARGDAGRWRRLARPKTDAIAAAAALAGLAPHLGEAIEHVVRHLRAAAAMGMPISLPPTVLLGPPGVGKTWLMTRLAGLLGLPLRMLPMNLTNTGDGVSGAHPVWKNASPGVVAKALLAEEVANPVILVDEFDKGHRHNGADAYSAFYTLLEPVGARSFTDEYYQCPFDASRIVWIMSANDLSPIPEPILNRVTVIDVHAPGPEHLAAVIDSVYADANGSRNGFFVPRLDPALRARLADQPPRSIRVMIEDAMVRAAAVGRRHVVATDLVERRAGLRRNPIGFVRPGRREA